MFVLGAIVPPTATVEVATGPTAGEATLHGTVDPNETPPNGLETTWQFEYSTNQTEWVKAPAGRLAASVSPVAVAQTITGLEGGTVYYVRLHAEKEYAGGQRYLHNRAAHDRRRGADRLRRVALRRHGHGRDVQRPDQPPAPDHDVPLRIRHDPRPAPRTGRACPCPASIGHGSSNVEVSLHLQGLQPHTTYHYRVVASNVRRKRSR